MLRLLKGALLAGVAGLALLAVPAPPALATDKDDYWDNYWDTHWQGYRNKHHQYYYGTPANTHNPYYNAYPSSSYGGYPNYFYYRSIHNPHGRAGNMLY